MKYFLTAFIAITIFLSSLAPLAEDTDGKFPTVISGKIDIITPYINDSSGEKASSSFAVTPSMKIRHKKTKISLNALVVITEEEIQEVDLLLEKSFELGQITATGGIGAYDSKKNCESDNDFFVAYANLDFPEILELKPFLYFETNTPLRDSPMEGGWLWKAGVTKSFEIENYPLDVKVEIGGNDGIYGSDPMAVDFVRTSISTGIEIGGLNYSPFVSVQKGFGGIAEDEWRTVVGVSVSF